jgi:hypothetical protein
LHGGAKRPLAAFGGAKRWFPPLGSDQHEFDIVDPTGRRESSGCITLARNKGLCHFSATFGRAVGATMCGRVRQLVLGLMAGLPLSACASIPPLEDDAITVSQIVQRVKCELWDAVPPPEGSYPTGPYQWLRDWTAKVDLTLETDDTGGISPGATFINPMRSITLPASGTFPQSFSFGVGGGISTTASRTETLSFTLSFAELRNRQYRGTCDPAKGLGLLGNLGLKEWMQAALAPASGPAPELLLGFHAPPSSAAKAATPTKPKTGPKEESFDPLQQKIDKLNESVSLLLAYADEARSYAASAQQLGKSLKRDDITRSPQEFIGEVQKTADYISMTQDAVDQANKQIKSINTQTEDLKKNADDAQVSAALKNAQDGITKANSTMSAAKNVATTALGLLPTNGPIDSIAHQVSFVVTLSGNVTPNWSLVRFKGPGTGNNGLASASRSVTHTLNISMGSPSDSGLGKVSVEQVRQLNNLHQESAFRNAIITQSAVGGTSF